MHKLLHSKWGYISIGKVLDKLKMDLESIVDVPELIHSCELVMGMLTKRETELPKFKVYRHDIVEKKRTGFFNDTAKVKVFPFKGLFNELFTPVGQGNKDTTPIFQDLASVAAKGWMDELH